MDASLLATTVPAIPLNSSMLASLAAVAVLAVGLDSLVWAYLAAFAVLASGPEPTVFTDLASFAVYALISAPFVWANGRAPTIHTLAFLFVVGTFFDRVLFFRRHGGYWRGLGVGLGVFGVDGGTRRGIGFGWGVFDVERSEEPLREISHGLFII